MIDVLAEAAAWTQRLGHENWPARFPRSLISRNAERRELYLVEAGDETVATLTLQWSDPRFWDGVGDDDHAGYVHRVAVRRAHAGRGTGYRLLEWADQQVRARGRAWLRLDVVTGNGPLRAYYEAAGFAHVRDLTGEMTLPNGSRRAWQTSLYQRPTAPRKS